MDDPKLLESLAAMRKAIRTRPGMYFGSGGPDEIPHALLSQVVLGVFYHCGCPDSCCLTIEAGDGVPQEYTIEFSHLSKPANVAVEPNQWIERGFGPLRGEMSMLAGAARSLTVSVGEAGMIRELSLSDEKAPTFRQRPASDAAALHLTFVLDSPTFGALGPAEFHRLAGFLRDQAALRRGLNVRLRNGKRGSDLAWRYPNGLSGFIHEADYSRFPLHSGQIEIHARKDDMELDAVLRFVHAGSADVWSWVNFQPIQGGAHLQGFGDALKRLFSDPRRGCRVVDFITNPDKRSVVKLPHPFLAAIHLQLPEPHYYGPTKDVLMGNEVRRFVRDACTKPIAQQWEELRKKRIQLTACAVATRLNHRALDTEFPLPGANW